MKGDTSKHTGTIASILMRGKPRHTEHLGEKPVSSIHLHLYVSIRFLCMPDRYASLEKTQRCIVWREYETEGYIRWNANKQGQAGHLALELIFESVNSIAERQLEEWPRRRCSWRYASPHFATGIALALASGH